jgi:hypothetical protein
MVVGVWVWVLFHPSSMAMDGAEACRWVGGWVGGCKGGEGGGVVIGEWGMVGVKVVVRSERSKQKGAILKKKNKKKTFFPRAR